MSKINKLTAVFILSLLIITFYFNTAGCENITLEDVTITALRNKNTKDKTQTAKKIELATFAAGDAISEELISDSGLTINSNGGDGTLATISIEGGSASQTLYLIDGRPVNSSSNGSFNIGNLPAGAFNSIEVIKGPVSNYYGPYGLAGAINFTQSDFSARHTGGIFSLNYGSGRNISKTIEYADNNNKNPWRLFLKKQNYGGSRDNSDFSGDFLSFAQKIKAAERLELYFSNYYSVSENGVPGVKPASNTAPKYGSGGSASLFDRQYDNIALFNMDAAYKISKNKNFNLKIFNDTQNNIYKSYFDNFLNAPQEFYGSYQTLSRGIFANYSQNNAHNSFVFGIDRAASKFSGDEKTKNLSTSKSQIVSYSPEMAYNSLWANFNANITASETGIVSYRKDYPNSFSSGDSWSGGYIKKINRNDSMKIFYAKGFRAPTINDLYYPGAGNVKLMPENSRYKSIVFTRKEKKYEMAAGIFDKNTKGLIEWFPDPADPTGFRWIPQNLNEFRARGITIDIKRKLNSNLSVSAGVTKSRYRQLNIEQTYDDWQSGEKRYAVRERHGRQLPETKAYLSLVKYLAKPRIIAALSGIYTGEMKFYYQDYENAPIINTLEKKIKANTVFNLELSKEIRHNETVFLDITNILNQKYERRFGSSYLDGNFPMPGRRCDLRYQRVF
ncbi:MAG: TonB-dependent receptor plug domain-containing protein [Candidatus Wallbacteria bacterium]